MANQNLKNQQAINAADKGEKSGMQTDESQMKSVSEAMLKNDTGLEDEDKKDDKKKKPKAGDRILRVKSSHPRDSFNLGRHVISKQYDTYPLNEQEAAELESEGAAAWLEEGSEQDKVGDEKLWREINKDQDAAI